MKTQTAGAPLVLFVGIFLSITKDEAFGQVHRHIDFHGIDTVIVILFRVSDIAGIQQSFPHIAQTVVGHHPELYGAVPAARTTYSCFGSIDLLSKFPDSANPYPAETF